MITIFYNYGTFSVSTSYGFILCECGPNRRLTADEDDNHKASSITQGIVAFNIQKLKMSVPDFFTDFASDKK